MSNPYAAPDAALTEDASGDGTYQPAFFAWTGRIGRLRYLAYASVIFLLYSIVIGGLAATVFRDSFAPTKTGLSFAISLPLYAALLVMAKRRMNDMDNPGWLAFLVFLPFLNWVFHLYLLCGRGTEGENSYGLMPSANSKAVIIGALILPFVFILGIVAAVALPAYQQYVLKAKAAAAHRSP